MLYFSDNVYNNVNEMISHLILNNNYKIVGSFGKSKYITDVDITNYIDTSKNNTQKIRSVIKDLPKNIKFLNFTTGFDPMFKLPWNIISESDVQNYDFLKAVEFLNNLFDNYKITRDDLKYCSGLLSQGNVNIDNLLLIEDHLYQKSKVKLNQEDVFKMDLDKLINENDNNILHFIINYEDDIIPIDVALVKEKQMYIKPKFDKGIYLMFLKKEYYFILAYMARYFYNEPKHIDNIKYLLYDSYGAYRQILIDLFYLKQFISFKIYSKNEFYEFASKVLNKMKKTTDFKNFTLFEKAIKEKNELDQDLFKIIDDLEDDVTQHLNYKFQTYAYNYYSMIYPRNKLKYDYLAFDTSILKENKN